MKPGETSTKCAGIDVGKRRLDVAVHGADERFELANEAGAFGGLVAWLKTRGVSRVGMEATGGYERGVRQSLEAAGFEVVIHQPLEVKLFARLSARLDLSLKGEVDSDPWRCAQACSMAGWTRV